MKKTVSISSLKGNENNPRTISDSEYQKLVKSITEDPQFLEKNMIIVDKDMVIISGNQRLKAATEVGLKKLPVEVTTEEDLKKVNTHRKKLKLEPLTYEQLCTRYMVKANNNFGEWHRDSLLEQISIDEAIDFGVDEEIVFGEGIDFNANINPGTSNKDITEGDMAKNAEKLAHQMETAQTLKTVMCPYCTEQFEIQDDK